MARSASLSHAGAPAPSRAALERTALDRAAGVLAQLFAYAPTTALRKLVDEASLAAVTGALSAAVAAAPGVDPLAAARARGVTRRDALLTTAGGVLSPGGVAERTGMSRQTVNNWRRKGQVIALPRGRRDFVFPACQFAEDRLMPGLDRVLAATATASSTRPALSSASGLSPSIRAEGASSISSWLNGCRSALAASTRSSPGISRSSAN